MTSGRLKFYDELRAAVEADSKPGPFGESGISRQGEAVAHLRQAVADGKHWYIALLEAIGRWNMAEEEYEGRRYRYLIDDEAFDWLLLAERLLSEVGSLVPQQEMEGLLFRGRPPIAISKEEFCGLIGEARYCAHLNYFYGVTVEQTLVLAVEQEAGKELRAGGAVDNGNGLVEEAHQRIYGAPLSELLKRFRREKGYPRRRSMELGEWKEFTYWLFKYRLAHSDKARIASDTKKGLQELEHQRGGAAQAGL